MKDELAQIQNTEHGIFGGYVHQRIKKNKNFMCCITGPTGSGKTYSALSFAQKWDKNFTSNNIVFTPQEFIDLLNSNTLKKGSVIIADEFGVSMNSRNWQSVSNQVINYVLQTFRSKNYIVLFTSPDFSFIDTAARKLFHCHMMTAGINHTEKHCLIKPYMLQINQRTGDIYYKYLRLSLKNTGEKKLSEIEVGLPTKKLIKEYEIKKDAFVTNLNLEIEAKLRDKQVDKGEKKDLVQNEMNIKANAIDKLRGEGKSWRELATLFNFNTDDAIRVWFSRNRTNNEP